MNKRFLSLLLIILLLCAAVPCAAFADNTIIANLGKAPAGKYLDQLVGTTESGTASCVGGTLPAGCSVVTEQKSSGACHYLRGTPMSAGVYEFTLSVKDDSSAQLATLTCSLTVTPAEPSVTVSSNVSCFLGDAATVSVRATVADSGSLSFRWFSSPYNSTANGTFIEGATGSSLQVSTSAVGTNYYYCEVTNTNNGSSTSVLSPTIQVSVSEPVLSSISINAMPAAREYKVGDRLNTSGLEIIVKYSNGTSVIVSSGFDVSPTTLNTAGTQNITVSYLGKTCTFPVLVTEAEQVVESILIVSEPTKREYTVGEWLDTSGLKLRIQTNKSTFDVTTGFSCTPMLLEKEGRQQITVNYGSKSAAFTVNVLPAEEKIESISVKNMPTKLSYSAGDRLDISGMVLEVTMNTGKTEEVSTGFSCTPMLLEKEGRQQITVSYRGKTCTFELVVSAAAEQTPAPEESAEPVETPQVTPKPDIPRESHTGALVVVIVIAAAVALAALGAYVFVLKHDKFQQFFGRFGKGRNRPEGKSGPDAPNNAGGGNSAGSPGNAENKDSTKGSDNEDVPDFLKDLSNLDIWDDPKH